MNHNFKNGEELFKAILTDPQILETLPINYKYDIDFLETFYIILEDQIKPYIPKEIFSILKHHDVIFKNNHPIKLKYKPQVTLKDEAEILHDLLTDPKTIETIPTNDKYNNDFLEMLYIIWEDEIEPYILKEMFETLKNEALMHEYHHNHQIKQKIWVKEEHAKKLKELP